MKKAKLKSSGDDTGTVWKNIKTWLGWSLGGPPSKLIENGSIFNKPRDLAKIMDNYFVSKVKNLRENLPPNQGDTLSLLRRQSYKKNIFVQYPDFQWKNVRIMHLVNYEQI